MLISICICTHNRAADVKECLASLLPQVDQAIGEVVIVDSASDSATAATLAEIARENPRVRLMRLEEPGLSIARNAAVAATTGEWIAFLDDDAVPFPDYFVSLVDAIGRLPPHVTFFGGRLKPRWPRGTKLPPLGERWTRMLSIIDDESERETELGLIFGANIVYKRSAVSAFDGPFDPSLGRIGTKLLGGEEMGLHMKLAEAGYEARFIGSIGVEHKVSPGRLSVRWLKERSFWEGMTFVALYCRPGQRIPPGARVPRQIAKICALIPRLLFADAEKETYSKVWQSIGVLRARLLS